MKKRLKKTFLWTFAGSIALIVLMLAFWPVETLVPTVRALSPSECPEPVVVAVPIPFPVYINRGGGSKGYSGSKVDPWKCWYSDRLGDWMCPVPAGAPFN